MESNVIDFDFSAKNKWRFWSWGIIANRFTPAQRAMAKVLYLPGPDDLDGPIAIARGFRRENLIGVERNHGICLDMRRRGCYCIWGDFVEVLRAWPSHTKLSVIFGDFCCGFQPNIIFDFREPLLFSNGIAKHAVIALNMLRGRDAFLGNWRRSLSQRSSDLFPEQLFTLNPKHRGQLFMKDLIFDLLSWGSLDDETHRQLLEQWHNVLKLWLHVMRPMYYSYLSTSGVTMDSVIFSHPFERMPGNHGDNWDKCREIYRDHEEWSKYKKSTRYISAVLAQRTGDIRHPRAITRHPSEGEREELKKRI